MTAKDDRTRRLAALVLVLVALVAACSTTPTSAPTAPTAAPTTAPERPDLLVALEIHVEGWSYDGRDDDLDGTDDVLEIHLAELDEVMVAAEAHGVVLTLELGAPFVDALVDAGLTDWAEDVMGRGHDVQVHADVGGTGVPSLAALTAQLTEQRTAFAALGVEPTVVTGVCSRGPWLDAVAAAGFTAVAGMVEYCLHSLDEANRPAGWDPAACSSPPTCHAALGSLLGLAEPWHAEEATDFLTDVPGAAVLLVPGVDGPVCGSEGNTSGCAWDDGDAAGFGDRLAAAVEGRGASQEVSTAAWSVGSPVTAEQADAVFAAMEAAVSGGGARFVTLGELVGSID